MQFSINAVSYILSFHNQTSQNSYLYSIFIFPCFSLPPQYSLYYGLNCGSLTPAPQNSFVEVITASIQNVNLFLISVIPDVILEVCIFLLN